MPELTTTAPIEHLHHDPHPARQPAPPTRLQPQEPLRTQGGEYLPPGRTSWPGQVPGPAHASASASGNTAGCGSWQ